ncbi:hypothetical protein MPEAHAMD_3625 [Methylobacterium frigidaeris]|uniref:Uncharacterized protein n=1 Tax=Methylobacterium frigidaeris TaxID=2038277 RepID=A0AA37M5G3_9HYPH|nr:hypothetical protein MPEAHAMD_3625 [Methylobacterium frigidaeris]
MKSSEFYNPYLSKRVKNVELYDVFNIRKIKTLKELKDLCSERLERFISDLKKKLFDHKNYQFLSLSQLEEQFNLIVTLSEGLKLIRSYRKCKDFVNINTSIYRCLELAKQHSCDKLPFDSACFSVMQAEFISYFMTGRLLML